MKKGNILIFLLLIAFSSCQKSKTMAENITLNAGGTAQTFENNGNGTLCSVEFQNRTILSAPDLYMVTGQAGGNNLMRLPLRSVAVGSYEITKNQYDYSLLVVDGMYYNIADNDTIAVTITQSNPLTGIFSGTVSRLDNFEQLTITDGVITEVPVLF